SCAIASLAVGAQQQFTVNVTPQAAAGASVTNTAHVQGGGDPACSVNCDSTPVTTTISAPALKLTKSASVANVTVGVPYSYTLKVDNVGTTATTAPVTVTDNIPTGLTINGTPAGCTVAGQAVTCMVPTGLATGGSSSFVISVIPTAAAVPSVTNTAVANGGGDPACNGAGNCTSTVTLGVSAPKLKLTKTASVATASVGVPFNYTLKVENIGNTATTAQVTVDDNIVPSLILGAVPAGCSTTGQTVICTIPTGLAAGASVSFVIPVTPTAASVPSVTNSAGASGGGDPTCNGTGNCTSAITIPVNGPAIKLTKTASVTTATVGVPFNYTLKVDNTGNSATTAPVVVTDAIPTGLMLGAMPAGCSAASQTVTCTVPTGLVTGGSTSFVIPVTATATAMPTVTNTAVANGGGDPACNGAGNCTSTVTLTVEAAKPATISGVAFYDMDLNGVQGAGDRPLVGYTVELLQTVGGTTSVIATTKTGSDGSYAITNLTPGVGYQVRFRDPIGNLILGTPFNQAVKTQLGHPSTGTNALITPVSPTTSMPAAQVITGITLYSGDNTIQQNLPLDPSGVVYDSVTRQPLAGATVKIVGPAGFDPAKHLVSGSDTYVTDSLGIYQFVFVNAPPAGTYRLEITPPANYVPPQAQAGGVAPSQGTLVVPVGRTLVQPQPTAPATGVNGLPGTRYYLAYDIDFATRPGEALNNHIPLDPIGALSGRMRLTKTAQPTNVHVGDLVRYTITIENTGTSAITDVSVIDTPPAGFSYVNNSVAVVDRDNRGDLVALRAITVSGIDIDVGKSAVVTYMLRVGAGVRPGTYTNQAIMRDRGHDASNMATADVQVVGDPMTDDTLILGTVFDDRDGDGWQDSADASGLKVQGGFSPAAYIANSTTVDHGDGPKPEADHSSPMLHGISLGELKGRQSDADPVAKHQIVIRQHLRELAFNDDFVLSSKEGVSVRMDAAGKTRVETSGDAAKGLNAVDLRVERKVAQVADGYEVDYVISNAGVDERGIPGVRIASVEGLLIETDQFGRYHVAAVPGGSWERGRNYILKVDPSTLPPGTTFTTDNPLVRRVTPGLPVRFDFGVKLPQGVIEGGKSEVEMELGEVVFAPGESEVREQYLPTIAKMADKAREHGGGEVVIRANGETAALAYRRAEAVKAALLGKLDKATAEGLTVSVRTDVNNPATLVAGIGGNGTLLGTVLFDTDKSAIRPEFEALLDTVAAELEKRGGGVIALVGHTDIRASHAYNTQLGLRRAKAVYEALTKRMKPEMRAKVRIDINDDSTAPVDVSVPRKSGDVR
ncbi:MAG: DUF11 domain-containing protein, partial [Proteobacteria bacterium]|nr:DUF11 domain-containing protein [Pseudomonadota bacterium]